MNCYLVGDRLEAGRPLNELAFAHVVGELSKLDKASQAVTQQCVEKHLAELRLKAWKQRRATPQAVPQAVPQTRHRASAADGDPLAGYRSWRRSFNQAAMAGDALLHG